jgi:alpha-L-fucosidase 2
VALDKKAEHWLRGPRPNSNNITHGMMNHAQAAARLGRGEEVHEVLSRMATRGYLFDGLMTACWPNRRGSGFDAVGAIPDVVNNSLAFSLGGRLQLLTGLPKAWPKGAICGILARGGLHIRRLAWDVTAGRIDLEITSRDKQVLTLSIPTVNGRSIVSYGTSG